MKQEIIQWHVFFWYVIALFPYKHFIKMQVFDLR